MKKGFTLIELLAVIVILAIIATIATPIVLSIINDSKEGAIFRSAEFYLDAVEYSVARRALDGNVIKDGTYSIASKGNICLYENEESVCTDELVVKVDGDIPKGGNITLVNGEIVDIEFRFENKVVIKDEEGLRYLTLADYVSRLYKETTTVTLNNIEYGIDENNGLINDRLGSNDVGKTDGNIRYYGASPNNYIDIGDRDSEGNIILWRIVGLFKDMEVTDENGKVIKTEDLIKIIRADKLTAGNVNSFSWDYTSTGSYANNWETSTVRELLNGAYYNSKSISYYNYSSNASTFDFASTGLSKNAYNKIENVNWNIGGVATGEEYVDSLYNQEITNVWSGKVGLMQSSDYGYASNLKNCQTKVKSYTEENCKTTNWLFDSTGVGYQSTMTRQNTNNLAVFTILGDGSGHFNHTRNPRTIRPVLYLKSNVGIKNEVVTEEGLTYLVVDEI